MPMASALHLGGLLEHVVDRHLGAEVVHLVAVVGEDDVDQVLADVVDVALDGGQHDAALAALDRSVSMWGSRWATDAFMVSADCRTNGSCIWPEPNSSPTTFIPPSRVSLTMARAGTPAARAWSRSASSPSRSPSMMRCARRFSTGQPLRSSFTTALAADPLEQPQELLQRVVVPGRVTAVVDQVEAHLDGPGIDLVERHDPRRVHDGGVEPRLLALVQEDRVEGVAGGRVQPEGDVGQPDDGAHAGQLLLDQPDALDGLDAVAAALLHPRGDGQHQRVEEQVARVHAVAAPRPGRRWRGRPAASTPPCGPGPPRRCRCRPPPPRTPGPG